MLFNEIKRRCHSKWKTKEALQWRHNERDGVSNNWHHDCLFSYLFRHRQKKKHQSSPSLAYLRNSPVTGHIPAQRASNAENISIWWHHHSVRKQIHWCLAHIRDIPLSHRVTGIMVGVLQTKFSNVCPLIKVFEAILYFITFVPVIQVTVWSLENQSWLENHYSVTKCGPSSNTHLIWVSLNIYKYTPKVRKLLNESLKLNYQTLLQFVL